VWRRKLGLDWSIVPGGEPSRYWRDADIGRHDATLGFDFAGTVTYLPIGYYDDAHGWSNGGNLGNADSELIEVIAHVINLPMIHGARPVHDRESHATWTARQEYQAGGWHCTIDATATHNQDFRLARDDQSVAVTHTVRVARADGSTFTPTDAEDVLSALQYALSFAVGYWVGLAAPVGLDPAGAPRWTQWGAPHAGKPQRGTGWWNDTRSDDLTDYLRRFLGTWDHPEPTHPLRFAVTSSILGNETGFVEQRIITAVAALDHLSWTHDVLENAADEHRWRSAGGGKRLRRVLTRMAVVPAYVTTPGRSALTQYGRMHGYHDLAETVIEVRNRLIHPKPDHNIYAYENVLLEAWRHSTYWLELAILHRLGYEGHIVDRTVPGRWAGDSDPVPWNTTTEPN
jgi:hypothetical protein